MRPELFDSKRNTVKERRLQDNSRAATQYRLQGNGRGREAIDPLAPSEKLGHFLRSGRPLTGNDGTLCGKFRVFLQGIDMSPRIQQPPLALPVIGIGQVVVNRGIDGRHEHDVIRTLALRQQILRIGKNQVRACELCITAKQARQVQKIAHHRLCIGRIAPNHFRVHDDRPAPRLCMLLL
ncbi:hypothetical protein D3C80_1269890 [compost metagenome]